MGWLKIKKNNDGEYLCSTCGCVVIDRKKHREFHEALVSLFEDNDKRHAEFATIVAESFGQHQEWSAQFAKTVSDAFEDDRKILRSIIDMWTN